ncbi:MAG: LysR family transcriptional regulator [Solirubrobacteraceae bacterium]
MFLRQLEYLDALARERHFGRAAKACHVSQPALSVAIRKLERELGVELVHRDRHYDDLTPEGRKLLRWAQQALAGVEGLRSEAASLSHELSGRLRLGVIPTALPAAALVAQPLLRAHPGVDLEIRSLSSIEIGRELESHGIDAGITYLDNEPLGKVRAARIYDETYALLTADDRPETQIAWAQLDGYPLCLLTPEMQNRRIIDGVLADRGATVVARIETNSISALLSFARAGWSCVVSRVWLTLYGVPEGMRALTLIEPTVSHEVGLLTPKSDLVAPVVRALLEALSEVQIP